MLLFLQGAWTFFKKYWQLFAGLAVGLLVFLLSIRLKPTTPDQTLQKRVEDETDKKEQEAAKRRDASVTDAEAQHDKAISDVLQQEKKKSDELIDDPDATNDFLKQVGKDIRGK